MAVNGAGITLLPDYLCRSDLNGGRLVRVLETWTGRRLNIYGIYPSRNGITLKVRALLDFLYDRLSTVEVA